MTFQRSYGPVDLEAVPNIVIPPPGPESRRMHDRAAQFLKGYSAQVKLFPVVFDKGCGVTLIDVDGNTYLDFSSGIYVTTLGHCHPKVSEAVARHAHTLMNAHDFTTPVKEKLMEKMVEVLPGTLQGMQLYSDGTSAVEAGLRAARAATNRHEFVSCFRDFHGKSMGAVSCAQMVRGDVHSYGPTRAPGFYMVPRPDPYRPTWPVSRARLISARTLSVALWCSVMPSVQQIWARSAVAYVWARSRIAAADTPVIRSASSRVYRSTDSA